MGSHQVDLSVLDFDTYNDYINSFATADDERFLSNQKIIKSIVQLGYRTTKVPYDNDEFDRRVLIAEQAIRPKTTTMGLLGDFMSPSNNDPVLLEFKRREVPNLNKYLSTIVFTSYISSDGYEISGYIDLDSSWRMGGSDTKKIDWQCVFEGRCRVRPMAHHLSYSNARYNMVKYTHSDNYLVMHDHHFGLLFMHKGDHKIITVGGQVNLYSRNAKRSMVYSPKLGYVVFYDHLVRKKV
ncbi:cilia- and flagella-associated protein 299 [Drosophila miranda]|uniref:cilia- and flagella-associated protein 299 n=1 Tax=Drosophila miranda TaxID=7229 RepID=UPI0007E743FF|nr:cilia- and flagella-associated protein 299 [Drosophila miranda]